MPLVPWLSATGDCWLLLLTRKPKQTTREHVRNVPQKSTSQKLSPVHLSRNHLTQNHSNSWLHWPFWEPIDEMLSFQQLRPPTGKQNTPSTKLCQKKLSFRHLPLAKSKHLWKITGKPFQNDLPKISSKTGEPSNSQKKLSLSFSKQNQNHAKTHMPTWKRLRDKHWASKLTSRCPTAKNLQNPEISKAKVVITLKVPTTTKPLASLRVSHN